MCIRKSLVVSLIDIPAGHNIVADGPGRLLYGESPNDVICLVKRYASDPVLSQDTESDAL